MKKKDERKKLIKKIIETNKTYDYRSLSKNKIDKYFRKDEIIKVKNNLRSSLDSEKQENSENPMKTEYGYGYDTINTFSYGKTGTININSSSSSVGEIKDIASEMEYAYNEIKSEYLKDIEEENFNKKLKNIFKDLTEEIYE